MRRAVFNSNFTARDFAQRQRGRTRRGLSRRLLYAAGEAAGFQYLIGVSKSVVMDRIAGEAAQLKKLVYSLERLLTTSSSGNQDNLQVSELCIGRQPLVEKSLDECTMDCST